MSGARFRPLRKHRSGAYGEVWLAEQTGLERPVALKVIKVEWADKGSAKAHAMALARLCHPNIVTVHSLENVEIEGKDFEAIVMEWLEGETLGDRLIRGSITKQELFRIIDQLYCTVKNNKTRWPP